MLEIIKEKEKMVSKIFNDTKKQLAEIFCTEFQEFDKVNIICHADFDELELYKENRMVKFHLTSTRYDSRKNLKGKGLYFRRTKKSGEDFSEDELKDIQTRLQTLYEK